MATDNENEARDIPPIMPFLTPAFSASTSLSLYLRKLKNICLEVVFLELLRMVVAFPRALFYNKQTKNGAYN